MVLFRVFVDVIAYLVGGVLFMKFKRDANGSDLISNIDMWKQLSSSIKVRFVLSLSSKATILVCIELR